MKADELSKLEQAGRVEVCLDIFKKAPLEGGATLDHFANSFLYEEDVGLFYQEAKNVTPRDRHQHFILLLLEAKIAERANSPEVPPSNP